MGEATVFTDPQSRARAQRAFEIFVSDLCSEHGRTWDEVSAELASSGFGPREVPAVIAGAWVAVAPDPERFTMNEHPANQGGLLLPRGALKQVERFTSSIRHPAGGRGTPARRLHPLSWIRSRHHGESRSA